MVIHFIMHCPFDNYTGRDCKSCSLFSSSHNFQLFLLCSHVIIIFDQNALDVQETKRRVSASFPFFCFLQTFLTL